MVVQARSRTESIKNKGSKGGRNVGVIGKPPAASTPAQLKDCRNFSKKKQREEIFSIKIKQEFYISNSYYTLYTYSNYIFHFHFFLILNSKIIIGLIDFVQF